MDKLINVKGISEKTAQLLNKLSIYDINDLLRYYPYRYDVIKRTDFLNAKENDKVVIDGVVESLPIVNYFRGRMNRLSFTMNICNRIVKIVIFNRDFLKNSICPGKIITVIGGYSIRNNIITASDIKLYAIDKPVVENVYHLTSGINNKRLGTLINNAILSNFASLKTYLPNYICINNNLLDVQSAIKVIHQPVNGNILKKAMISLKYEELFIFMMKILYLKQKIVNDTRIGINKHIDMEKINSFITSLPFELTIDQKKSINEILADLKSNTRMNRLLQGDVGSGKTVVAIVAMVAVSSCNKQSVLMAPTEILARQHYHNILKLCPNIRTEILLGSTPKKEKKAIILKIINHEVDFIIGTHALIQEEVKFADLGLVITDEQHRFGVNQRLVLHNKGNKPDILYMSATPIPRTYALTIYGDMSISNIRTVPVGRKEVITKLFSKETLKDALMIVKEELDMKHQVYVVAPIIDDTEESSESVTLLQKQMKLAFKNSNIDILHGKMKPSEKEHIMTDFKDNKIDILISTTVVEVGMDIPNATVMLIFDAHKFGLATLHQLRGRVGRNSLTSYCLLVSDKDNKRLHIMEEISDGFLISEADFENRGQGDLFGTKQHGDMNFKIADLKKDYKILIKAKEDAEEFLKNYDLCDYQELFEIITGEIA